jgi:uncharacterized DUF497 family protein
LDEGLYVFEWDDAKNASNIEKHGVSFEEVLQFDFTTAEEFTYVRNNELRTSAFGLINNRLYCLVYSNRGCNRRVISFRKANAREVNQYAKKM